MILNQEGTLGLTLISVVIGLVLAVAYHFLSMRLQTWVSRRNSTLVPVVTILGFFVRLTLLAIVLVVLGLWTPVNILALALAFIAAFTILNAIWLYSLMGKRRSAPPSAGATGAR